MLSGVGNIIIGNQGFDEKLISVCTSSFSLDQKYSTYGFEYINSSEKMLKPSIDHYDTKEKAWTLTLDFSIIPTDVWNLLIGPTTLEMPQAKMFVANCTIDGNPVIIDGATSIKVYNATKQTIMTIAPAPGAGEYSYSSGMLTFSGQDRGDLVIIYYISLIPTVLP